MPDYEKLEPQPTISDAVSDREADDKRRDAIDRALEQNGIKATNKGEIQEATPASERFQAWMRARGRARLC